MRSRPSEELEELLNALTDETLSESGEIRLAEILRGDAAARSHYRKWMTLHAALMWDYAAVIPATLPETSAASHRSAARGPWRRLSAVAAAIALFVTPGAIFFHSHNHVEPPREIAEVKEVEGSLSWTGQDGEIQSGIVKGRRLAAGNFQLRAETGTAVLQFTDGTRLTLGGGTDVFVADEGQKRVQLKSGTLGAEVSPQPKGRPLLIRTPTALLEVIGTVFSVTAALEQTTMSVLEGHVRFERLADGETVDVAAHHAVTASLESTPPLAARRIAMPPNAWHTDFTNPPPAGSRGEWTPASSTEPARIRSAPILAGHLDATPIIHHGIFIRDYSQPNAGAFVTVASSTVVHLRYRMRKTDSLHLFCITQRPGGAFAGNFELSLPADVGSPEPGADGWRTLDVPLSSLRPLQPHYSLHPAGNGISHFCVETTNGEAGLEVASMEFSTP